MIIIGEKLNTSLKAANAAVEHSDEKAIKEIALGQLAAGADFIDINCGTYIDDEPERLEWLVKVVRSATNAPLCIDSPNPAALKKALEAAGRGTAIINSITGEETRFNAILPLIKEFDARVIALCMDDSGMPDTAADRLRIAQRLVERLTSEGIGMEKIFIDPIVRPIGVDFKSGVNTVETIRKIREHFPEVHIVCGLSNISYGIPARKLINQAFLVAAMSAGLNSAILDPLDRRLMSLLYAAKAVLGEDEYCMNYIQNYREGKLTIDN